MKTASDHMAAFWNDETTADPKLKELLAVRVSILTFAMTRRMDFRTAICFTLIQGCSVPSCPALAPDDKAHAKHGTSSG